MATEAEQALAILKALGAKCHHFEVWCETDWEWRITAFEDDGTYRMFRGDTLTDCLGQAATFYALSRS